MRRQTRNRLFLALALLLCIGSGIYLTLYFLSGNIVFFLTPSELSHKQLHKKVRIGGLVEVGSIKKPAPNITIFSITDGKKSLNVKYKGILPALFRESQGIVAEGILEDPAGIFNAKALLTKHDENYKPPTSTKPINEVSNEQK